MKTILAVAAMGMMIGCAAPNYNNVVIDNRGVDTRQFGMDQAECRRYADQVNTAARGATSGAAAGALLGGVVGAIFGNSDLALQTAGAGAVLGAADGAATAAQSRGQIVKNCLRGRGYRVLN